MNNQYKIKQKTVLICLILGMIFSGISISLISYSYQEEPLKEHQKENTEIKGQESDSLDQEVLAKKRTKQMGVKEKIKKTTRHKAPDEPRETVQGLLKLGEFGQTW